jgi:trk system potassium uptake protein
VIWAARLRRSAGQNLVAVDLRAAANLVGALVKYLSVSLLLPTGVALAYGESPWPFLAAGAVTAGAGFALQRTARGREHVGACEAFLVAAVIAFVVLYVGLFALGGSV